MNLKEYALLHENYIDMDVTDTDIDMLVAFVYDPTEEIKDEYDRFLNIIAENVQIDTEYMDKHNVNADRVLVCDFSGYFRNFNSELEKLNKREGWRTLEFDGDETYYDYVLWLECLISGGTSYETYKKLNDVLESK